MKNYAKFRIVFQILVGRLGELCLTSFKSCQVFIVLSLLYFM